MTKFGPAVEVLEELIDLYSLIERYPPYEATPEQNKLVIRNIEDFANKYIGKFCDGPVMRLYYAGKIPKKTWFDDLVRICNLYRKYRSSELREEAMKAKDPIREYRWLLVRWIDDFKYALHANPIGRLNFVLVFPFREDSPPITDESTLIKLINYLQGLPVGFNINPLLGIEDPWWQLSNSLGVVFGVISSLRWSPDMARRDLEDIKSDIRRNMEEGYWRYY